MSELDDDVLIKHMQDAAREALLFARGRERRDLITDRQLALAVVKCLEIMGEAANRLSNERRRGIPDVPWDDVIAMRHRLVHDYSRIDLDVVWRTLEEDLPPVIEALERS